jgi:hypothetical protein
MELTRALQNPDVGDRAPVIRRGNFHQAAFPLASAAFSQLSHSWRFLRAFEYNVADQA